MQYFVRELNDGRALLIAEDGYPLSRCDSVDDAVATCIIHCRVAPLWIEWRRDFTANKNRAGVQGVDRDQIQQALARHCKPKVFADATRLSACA